MNQQFSMSQNGDNLPLLLNGLDVNLGEALPESSEEWFYSPESQTTNMIDIIEREELSRNSISCTGMFGDTTPTTTSRVAETTGFINTDSDESNDDEGTD